MLPILSSHLKTVAPSPFSCGGGWSHDPLLKTLWPDLNLFSTTDPWSSSAMVLELILQLTCRPSRSPRILYPRLQQYPWHIVKTISRWGAGGFSSPRHCYWQRAGRDGSMAVNLALALNRWRSSSWRFGGRWRLLKYIWKETFIIKWKPSMKVFASGWADFFLTSKEPCPTWSQLRLWTPWLSAFIKKFCCFYSIICCICKESSHYHETHFLTFCSVWPSYQTRPTFAHSLTQFPPSPNFAQFDQITNPTQFCWQFDLITRPDPLLVRWHTDLTWGYLGHVRPGHRLVVGLVVDAACTGASSDQAAQPGIWCPAPRRSHESWPCSRAFCCPVTEEAKREQFTGSPIHATSRHLILSGIKSISQRITGLLINTAHPEESQCYGFTVLAHSPRREGQK